MMNQWMVLLHLSVLSSLGLPDDPYLTAPSSPHLLRDNGYGYIADVHYKKEAKKPEGLMERKRTYGGRDPQHNEVERKFMGQLRLLQPFMKGSEDETPSFQSLAKKPRRRNNNSSLLHSLMELVRKNVTSQFVQQGVGRPTVTTPLALPYPMKEGMVVSLPKGTAIVGPGGIAMINTYSFVCNCSSVCVPTNKTTVLKISDGKGKTKELNLFPKTPRAPPPLFSTDFWGLKKRLSMS